MNMTHARAWTVALTLLVGCERAPDPAIGRAAAERARAHVTSGLGAVDRLTTGLARAMQGTSAPVGAAMGEVPRLRRALRDLHDDHTPLGRELTLYPLSFVVAVRPDGKAAASDRSGEPDVMADRDLGAAFPCVRAAAQGTAGTCAGQFGLTEGVTRRWFVAAVPARASADAPAAGAVVAMMTFGNIAKAVRGALDMETTRDGVQLSVGILHEGRTYPAGTDNDVAARYLVREPLVRAIPADIAGRAGREAVSFNFTERGGRLQWGAAASPAASLGEGAALLVFRAPVRQ